MILEFLVGLFLGALLCYLFLKERMQAMFREWKLEFGDKIRKETLDRSRGVIKGKIGEQLAPLLPMFEYNPSDARFIGSPVDYIVF